MNKFFVIILFLSNLLGKCNCQSRHTTRAINTQISAIKGNSSYTTSLKLSINNGVGKTYNNNVANSNHPKVYFDGNITEPYYAGGEQYYPVRTIIDLEGIYKIEKLIIHDRHTNSGFTVRSGKTLFDMKVDASLQLDEELVRTILFKQKQVGFIELELAGGKGPAEIEVYGTPVILNPEKQRVYRPYRLYKDLIGSNGNEHGPIDLYPWKGCMFREYDYTSLYLNKSDTLFKFNPNYEVPGGFMFMDDHYAATKAAGIVTMPVIFTSPENIYKPSYVAAGLGDQWHPDYPPVKYGHDKSDPASYISIGRLAYQVGARYGRTSVPDKNLKVDLTEHWHVANTKKTALDLLQYVEFGNEPNRWWGPKEVQWQPYEIAAYLSCVYDGHEGKLGPLAGIKAADPTMKLVMSALADYGLETIKLIYYWAKAKRKDGKFPADAINIHGYTTTGGNQYNGDTKGVAPEIFLKHGLKSSMNELTEWIHENLPGTEIMWTEFGYDSNKKSIMGIPLLTKAQRAAANHPLNSLQMQGALILRTQMEMLSVPYLDRMLQFQMWNENYLHEIAEPDQETNLNDKGYYDPYYAALQFSTSGLTQGWYSPKPFARKPSWYIQHNAYHALSNCKFKEDKSTEQYRHYIFSDSAVKEVHVLWKPTQDGSQVNSKKIDLNNSEATSVAVESSYYRLASLTPINKSIVVDINEMPKIIICPKSMNKSPVVNLGMDKRTSDTTLTITGKGTDPDGTIASWKWTKKLGHEIKMVETFTAEESLLTLNGIKNGNYVFELVVTDDRGATQKDEITIIADGVIK